MNVLLIDLSSIAHMEFHVSGDNPDPDATAQKTVARVRALASGKPHVGICLDTPPYFRKDIDPQYKANRAKDNNAVIAYQIAHAIDTLQADGFPVFGAAGYEADDIIATAVLQLELMKDRPGDQIVAGTFVELPRAITIATADKDLFQLVSDSVSIHSIRSGNVYDGQAVKEKLGVEPHQVVDYLALVGDSSDNIQGAKGIGAKRAAELLDIFGNADDAIRAAKEIIAENGKKATAVEKSLVEFEARLPTVRDLIRLRTDAPIDCAPLFQERKPMELTDAQEQGVEFEDEPVEIKTDPPIIDRVAQTAERGPEKSGVAGSTPAPVTTIARTPDILPAPVAWNMQLEPRSMSEAKQVAADLFASRHFSAYGNAPAVLSTVLAGRELGFQTMASLRAFHIIDGKPTLSAGAIHSLILSSGKAKYFRCTERTPTKATFVTQRGDDPPFPLTFTIEEGRAAWPKDEKAWLASGWGKNPADMLVARALTKLARLVYPDVCHGLYAPEEF